MQTRADIRICLSKRTKGIPVFVFVRMHACLRACVQMHAQVHDTREYVCAWVRACALLQTSADIRARLRVHALNAVHAVHALSVPASRVSSLGRFVA